MRVSGDEDQNNWANADANQALRTLLASRIHEGLAGNVSAKSIGKILDEELTPVSLLKEQVVPHQQ